MSLDKMILKFENAKEANDEDLAYGYIEKYNKDDVIRTIREYQSELFGRTYINGEYSQKISRFLKAISPYIKDEDILIELFRINGKKAFEAIASYTDLLKKEQSKMLVYRAAIERK